MAQHGEVGNSDAGGGQYFCSVHQPQLTPRSTKAIGNPLGWSTGGYEKLFRIMDINIY
jgi:hypothetical protein